jgi:hypothetical protein
MTETIRLAPHDPVPDYGDHALVLRRMGEDDPGAVVTELVFYGVHGSSTALPPGKLEEAVLRGLAEAEKRGVKTLYVVDRTAGRLEQEALGDHGERNFDGNVLEDTDAEDGVRGADLRDRPHDAGFMR